jgi:hypothetical protein
MKKLITLLFVLMSLNLYAGIYGRVEIGTPVGNSYYYTERSKDENYNNTFFTNLVLGYKGYLFNVIDYRVYTGIFTWGNRNGVQPKGYPFEDIYGIGSRIGYKGMYVQYNHFCAHPVIHESRNTTMKNNMYIPDNKSWSSGMTTITVGYEFELK